MVKKVDIDEAKSSTGGVTNLYDILLAVTFVLGIVTRPTAESLFFDNADSKKIAKSYGISTCVGATLFGGTQLYMGSDAKGALAYAVFGAAVSLIGSMCYDAGSFVTEKAKPYISTFGNK